MQEGKGIVRGDDDRIDMGFDGAEKHKVVPQTSDSESLTFRIIVGPIQQTDSSPS